MTQRNNRNIKIIRILALYYIELKRLAILDRLAILEKEEREEREFQDQLEGLTQVGTGLSTLGIIGAASIFPNIDALTNSICGYVENHEVVVVAQDKISDIWLSIPSHIRRRIKIGATITGGAVVLAGILLICPKPTLRGGISADQIFRPPREILPGALAKYTPELCLKVAEFAYEKGGFPTGTNFTALSVVNNELLFKALGYLNETFTANQEVNFLNVKVLYTVLQLCKNQTMS